MSLPAVLTFAFLVVFVPNTNAASLVSSYQVTGSFQRNGERAYLPWARPHNGIESFDSYGGSDARTGTLRTAVFQTPAEIHLFVSGFPSSPGIRIYLLDEARHRSIDLTNRMDPALKWKMHYWQLPKDWRGIPVRMVVEDNGTAPNAWVGVTLPEAGGQRTWVSLERAGERNGLVIFLGLLFPLPGLAGCALLSRGKNQFDLKRAVSAVLVISSVSGLCIFGLFMIGPAIGHAASLVLMVVSSIVIAALHKRLFGGQPALRRELAACLAAVLLAGVFSCSLGNLYTTDDEAGENAQVRYSSGMPPDNLLPQMFAQRLYYGIPVRPTLFGYWHSSDRPPLETAIVLMEMSMFPSKENVLGYQSLGIFLQCTWVAGVWVLLRTAGLSTPRIAFCLAVCLFSYFCLFHSFYVWAKLLSATFCLLALSFFPFMSVLKSDSHRGWQTLDGALAGAAFALSMLCHPGVVFTVAGILVVAAFTRSLPPVRVSLIALASLVLLLLPWQAYQKFYDPPGDNLMKAHLAGVSDFKHSLSECIITAYSHLTFHQWALNKWANLKILFYGDHVVWPFPWDTNRNMKELIESTFFYLSFTLGFLNIGLLVRIWRRGQRETARFGGRLLTIALVSLVLWCLVMFDPGSTVVHQGSFATVLLLFLGLSVWLIEGAPRLAVTLLAIQVVAVFPIFVFARPLFNRPGTIGDAPLDAVMGAVAIASLGGFALLFRRTRRTIAFAG